MSSNILTNWLENSTGRYFAPKTFDTLVFMQSASQTQGKLVDLPTYFQEAVFNREIKIDLSHNNTCALGSMEDGSWPGVTGILGTANGGTGNADGYIRTGANTATADPGEYSTIEGYSNTGSGKYSHSENANNVASGEGSHAQGFFTVAEGYGSHSGGFLSEAYGQYAFTHGSSTIASGTLSFAIGNSTAARGANAFAAGNATIAKGDNSFVIGKYNIEDTDSTYAFIIGNGGSNSASSNAFTIDWNGNAFVKTKLSAASIDITNGLSASDIEVSNDLVIDNNLSVGGSATIAKGLIVSSEGATITGNSSIIGTLSVTDILTASSNVDIGGNLTVAGAAEITGLLTAIAGINAQDASTFTDAVTIAKDLTVQQAVSITQSLVVGGDAAINGAISNATWDGAIIDVVHGGTGRDALTANALLMGNGSEDVSFINPVDANKFLVSNGADSAPSYKTLNIESGSDEDNVFIGLKLENSDTYISAYDVPAASNTVAGIVTAIAQTFGGVKTFSDATLFQSNITIAGNVLPEADGYMVGTTNQPWSDVIAWNISADTITSAFGGLTISNGNSQIEIIQNDKITLTGSQVHLDCGAMTISSPNYGYQLPDTGIEGQIFFLLLNED